MKKTIALINADIDKAELITCVIEIENNSTIYKKFVGCLGFMAYQPL